MAQFNPQFDLEFTELDASGNESRTNKLISLLNSTSFNGVQINDYRHHQANKPIRVSANIRKDFTSAGNMATISITNSLFIEELKRNPKQFIKDLNSTYYRVRIWAWYDDNNLSSATPRPAVPPVFVGDVMDGVGVNFQADGTDSTVTIQAESHKWLMTSGAMKKTWGRGFSYLQIVQDLLQEIVDRGYGSESFGQPPTYVIQQQTIPELSLKQLKRSKSITENPMNELNAICRDFDAVWGVENNVPFFCLRKEYFQPNRLNQTPVSTVSDPLIQAESGKIGLTSIGMYDFKCSSLWDNRLIMGNYYGASDAGMFLSNPNASFELDGRLDDVSINLDNYQGHTVDMRFSYFDSDINEVVLPQRRDDSGGGSRH